MHVAKSTLTPEEGVELQRLQKEYETASSRATQIIRQHGMDSAEFRESEAKTALLARKIKEIKGVTTKDWP